MDSRTKQPKKKRLLALNVMGTMISNDYPNPSAIPEQLPGLLKQMAADGWIIIVVPTTINSGVDQYISQELKRHGIDTCIQKINSKYHKEDARKCEIIAAYQREKDIHVKNDAVYFFDHKESYVRHAKNYGFTHAYQVENPNDLVEALQELISAYKKADEEPATPAQSTPKPGPPSLFAHTPKSAPNAKDSNASLLSKKPNEIVEQLFIAPASDFNYMNGQLKQLIASVKSKKHYAEDSEAKLAPIALLIHNLNSTCTANISDRDLAALPANQYLALKIDKSHSDNIAACFEQAVKFIDEALANHCAVHIQTDVMDDPGTVFVAAYLINKFNLSARDACRHIINRRPCAEDHLTKHKGLLTSYHQHLHPPAYPITAAAPSPQPQPVPDSPVRPPASPTTRRSAAAQYKEYLRQPPQAAKPKKPSFFGKYWPGIIIGGILVLGLTAAVFAALAYAAPVVFGIIATWAAATFAFAGGLPAAATIAGIAATLAGMVCTSIACAFHYLLSNMNRKLAEDDLPGRAKSKSTYSRQDRLTAWLRARRSGKSYSSGRPEDDAPGDGVVCPEEALKEPSRGTRLLGVNGHHTAARPEERASLEMVATQPPRDARHASRRVFTVLSK